MDGLLVATEEIYTRIGRKICARYGKNFTLALKQKISGTTDIRSAEVIVKELNLPITPEEYCVEWHREKNEQFKSIDSNAIMMPGAEKLVHHLHKNRIPMAIASGTTNSTFQLLSQKLNKLFILFHHVVLASTDPDIKLGKPAPDVFLVCAQRFSPQPSPARCLVFEDAPSGVTGAVRAGMQVVMVPPDYISDEFKREATLVLNSLEDFRPEWFGLPSYSTTGK